MARPKIEEKEKRTVNFTIRLTENELRRLVILSNQLGKAPAVLIREKVFKNRFPLPQASKVDADTFAQIKRIGVNLNQLTRQVNAGRQPAALFPLLNTLLQQQALIIEKLIHT